ncbi:LapA family protein [Pseudomonas nabeulensis]|uniref:LapA family protein n=1 Tax=Pseudomonas nabeulensis TaxID=2293833 RepID=A0A4Z0BBP8_9PSED|nr:lipopolysaccharide assembly protein LapA domain-containing protein [Pseudomonas nabeulensis]TFY95847.1 LapA family protein [Pseudomonas nabeulensis]
MRGIKRVVVMLAVLVVALVVLAFVLENQQVTTLSFFGFATRQMPVSVFVIMALIVGMLMGPLLNAMVRKRRRTLAPTARV